MMLHEMNENVEFSHMRNVIQDTNIKNKIEMEE
jgi:hypothetical protein